MNLGIPDGILCKSGGVTGNDAPTTTSILSSDTVNLSPLPTDAPRSLLAEELIEDRKDDLRGGIKERRSQLDARTLRGHAEEIARRVLDLTGSLGLREGDTVAAYVSRSNEPGMFPTLDILHDAGIEVLVPVLGPALDRCWGRYTGRDELAQLAPGRPLEPRGVREEADAVGRARLILVPALAIDDVGVRLGLGGGWYDRALLHASPDAVVVGVVYDDEAHHTLLPRADHDVPVGGVLTPTSWWRLTAA